MSLERAKTVHTIPPNFAATHRHPSITSSSFYSKKDRHLETNASTYGKFEHVVGFNMNTKTLFLDAQVQSTPNPPSSSTASRPVSLAMSMIEVEVALPKCDAKATITHPAPIRRPSKTFTSMRQDALSSSEKQCNRKPTFHPPSTLATRSRSSTAPLARLRPDNRALSSLPVGSTRSIQTIAQPTMAQCLSSTSTIITDKTQSPPSIASHIRPTTMTSTTCSQLSSTQSTTTTEKHNIDSNITTTLDATPPSTHSMSTLLPPPTSTQLKSSLHQISTPQTLNTQASQPPAQTTSLSSYRVPMPRLIPLHLPDKQASKPPTSPRQHRPTYSDSSIRPTHNSSQTPSQPHAKVTDTQTIFKQPEAASNCLTTNTRPMSESILPSPTQTITNHPLQHASACASSTYLPDTHPPPTTTSEASSNTYHLPPGKCLIHLRLGQDSRITLCTTASAGYDAFRNLVIRKALRVGFSREDLERRVILLLENNHPTRIEDESGFQRMLQACQRNTTPITIHLV
jgi:hypothetical protein